MNNVNVLIGLLTILLLLWTIIYAIPSVLISFFHTILGNIIILLCIYLVSIKNTNYGILLFVVFIVLYQFSKKREAFSQWSDKTINDFLVFQNTINPGIVFDTSLIQEQATEEDAKELLQTGKWRWSPEVEELYMDAVSQNPYIRINSEDSTNNAKTIYNENAILQILKMQSPEGRAIKEQSDPTLIQDNTFGINSGLISKTDTVIRCTKNPKTNMPQLLKSKYIGNDGVFHARQYEHTFIDDTSYSSQNTDVQRLMRWCT
jgi:hypothetical protein